ncbi:MAG: acetylglutamate kinase [Halanaerobiaceae bacterium]
MDKIIEKAEVLIESLPYIREFKGKIFVIKYGGSVLANDEIKKSVVEDIILLKYVGVNPVIVHGGGPAITEAMKAFNKESKFVQGLRVTDKETMELVEMVLMGKVNKDIVSLVNKIGGKAVGISGKDGELIQASKYCPAHIDTDLGFVGCVDQVNPQIVNQLIAGDYIPVIAPVGGNENGDSFNINADTVAGELAISLGAEKFIFLTDVDGIRADHRRADSRVSSLSIKQAREWIKNEKIKGGMVPKVKACLEAVSNGVAKTHIINGLVSHALLLEIFTDHGVGTMILQEREANHG